MRRWFLLTCAIIGAATLIALWPPRTSTSTVAVPKPSTVNRQPSTVNAPLVLPTDPIRGQVDAPFTIIEYGDFTCPSCVDAYGILETLRTEYGPRLRIVWKDFPALHRITGSRRTHIAARCAQRQGAFWEYHDAVLNEQPRGDGALLELASRLGLTIPLFTACLTNEATATLVDTYRIDAEYFNLRSAPTFFVNGTRLDGHPTIDDFRALLRVPTP